MKPKIILLKWVVTKRDRKKKEKKEEIEIRNTLRPINFEILVLDKL